MRKILHRDVQHKRKDRFIRHLAILVIIWTIGLQIVYQDVTKREVKDIKKVAVTVKNKSVEATKEVITVKQAEAKTLVKKKVVRKKVTPAAGVRAIIIQEAKRAGINQNTLMRLIACESGYNAKATGYNHDKVRSKDRGAAQINSYWHREVSNACAYSARCSIRWTANMIKKGELHQWSCAKKI